MSTLGEKRDRHTIPRWRPSSVRVNPVELESASSRRVPLASGTGELDLRLREWEEERTLPFAADLIGLAHVLDRPERARDAAQFVLSQGDRASASVRRIALRILGFEEGAPGDPPTLDEETRRTRIRSMRQRLSEGPRNPLLWMDLAREYVIVGADEQAGRCVRIAHALAPDSRFVLRTAARFYVHRAEPDVAHDLLRRSALLKLDPWVLAAEIAVAEEAGRRSHNVRLGQAIVSSGKFPPRHISELASALATLELQAGARKRARRLFRQSLEEPTENAVAQAMWVASHRDALAVPEQALEVPRTFEARAWRAYHGEVWPAVLDSAWKWLRDEPFSVMPAVLGSHVAAVALEDYRMSEEFARSALRANPRDFTLQNNLAFALASGGNPEEAQRVLSHVDESTLSERDRIFFLATNGLVRYRLGDQAGGRYYYSTAIEAAETQGRRTEQVLAMLFLAGEEIRLGSEEGLDLLARVEGQWKEISDWNLRASTVLLHRLRNLAKASDRTVR